MKKSLQLQEKRNHRKKEGYEKKTVDFKNEKEHFDNKKEAEVNKMEDMELFGSYGSTLFNR